MVGGAWWGDHAWQGACVAGGMHAWQGVCMAEGHAWQGGMHGSGGMCDGVCMTGACMAGGMHGRGCAWQVGGMHGMHGPPPSTRYYEIQSMSRWYTSYWNAYLL